MSSYKLYFATMTPKVIKNGTQTYLISFSYTTSNSTLFHSVNKLNL